MAEANANAAADQATVGVGARDRDIHSGTSYDDKGRAAVQSFESDQDIGADESVAAGLATNTNAWMANVKRTYDEYQQESLESIKRNRSYVDKVLSDAQQYDNQRQNIANQALQNAVETANMVSKQAVRHSDMAIDRQWNVDEVSTLTAKSGVQADAMIAILADAIAKALNK